MAKRKRALRAEREQLLTAQQIRELLDYNSETGVLTWRLCASKSDGWNKQWAGKRAGCLDANGYVVIHVKYGHFMAHRVAWLWMTGEWPLHDLDHENRNPGDNRFSNLRHATHSQNCCNRGRQSNNTSGLKGAYWDKSRGKWLSLIGINGRYKHLGRFETAEEAHAAYCDAAAKIHGQFARLA